jgi:predicted Zn finger-like uncharacterized protein
MNRWNWPSRGDPMPMTVACPNCSSCYALPAHLLGPSGARVCCPACWNRFSLDPEGNVVPADLGVPVAVAAAAAANPAPAAPPAPAARWEDVPVEPTPSDEALDALFGPFGPVAEAPGPAGVADEERTGWPWADPPPEPAGPAEPCEAADAWKPPPAAEPPADPHDRRDFLLAREALAGLEPAAREVRGAAERGRLFSEFGPRLLEAFDRYRIAGGEEADPRAFRDALRERLGLEIA